MRHSQSIILEIAMERSENETDIVQLLLLHADNKNVYLLLISYKLSTTFRVCNVVSPITGAKASIIKLFFSFDYDDRLFRFPLELFSQRLTLDLRAFLSILVHHSANFSNFLPTFMNGATEGHTAPGGCHLATKCAVQYRQEAIKSEPGRAGKLKLFVLPKPPEPLMQSGCASPTSDRYDR